MVVKLRKDQAAELLKGGSIPSEIARRMGISTASVVQYLRTKVGEGTLRLSDIYFVFPPTKRDLLKQAAKLQDTSIASVRSFLDQNRLTLEELALYLEINRRTTFAGDLYEYLSETELALHDMVAATLKQAYGDNENGYWRRGVPVTIRTKCQERREADDEPCDSAFHYTDLLDLYEIIAKNWQLFQDKLPQEYRSNRNTLKSHFNRLNWIRNSVMHPVKRRRWSEDDFQFAAKVHEVFPSYRTR
jgi:exonuclease VII large subunit